MPNYQNGTIYKLCCKDPEITDCYVGSTVDHNSRKSQHKSICNNEKTKEYNYPVYRYIRDNGGWENWSFVLLEDYPCRNKKQLNIRERFWFEKLNATLNSHYPERSKKEYRKKHKEKIKELRKKHYEENKVEIKEQNKKYKEENKVEIEERRKEKVECQCGSVIRKDSLARHKKSQKHQEWEQTQVD